MNKNFFLTKGLFVLGVTIWMSLIVSNNITDFHTNQYLLGKMFTMSDLKIDPFMGHGITWRAIDFPLMPSIALSAVICLQLTIVLTLWRSSFLFLRSFFNKNKTTQDIVKVIRSANLSFTLIMVHFFIFLCGGMWFGYWMKLGAVQAVHMQFLVISLLGLLLINSKGYEEPLTDCK